MSVTQINGATQIRSATITTTQLSASAGIVDGQLASSYIYANGTRAFTAAVSHGGFQINNVATPTSATDAATKGYVDGIAQGLNAKYAARASTVGTETFTVASGSVTQITGTTVDGQSPLVGEYILIKDAPASTGTGSVNSTQPGNGLYQVTSNTTNLSVSRAADMSGTNSPAGAYVFIESGTTWASTGWVISTPNTAAAFTYGSGNIAWTQFSGAGDITVDSTLTKTGNALSRAAITGDVTIATNSNASTIAAAAVTLSKMANLAAQSVIGNSTGSSATPTAVSMTSFANANAVAIRDSNADISVNSVISNVATTPTAAGTTTLTFASGYLQQFTGITTQTVVLPNCGTVTAPAPPFCITNRSTGVVTVQTNGGATLQIMQPGTQAILTLMVGGSGAGTWDVSYTQAPVFTAIDSSLVNSSGTIGRAALTGDVTASASSNATTIASNAVTYAKFQQVAANSVVGNATGSAANATAVAMTSTATASAVVLRDSNANAFSNAFVGNMATINATTTLTASSAPYMYLTNSSAIIITLPASLPNATTYYFYSAGTGAVTVQDALTVTQLSIPASAPYAASLTLINGTWKPGFLSSSIPPQVPGSGIVKSNGTILQVATAGTDYMAPTDFVTRETPSGTPNGSTTSFGLANTPITGTEQIFLNGVLQDAGAGNDYTISGSSITMLNAPATGDKLRVVYQK